jgi:Secretion system C-terminal sorting domain
MTPITNTRFVSILLISFLSIPLFAQSSKNFTFIEAEPTGNIIAYGGSQFILLTDNTSVFVSDHYSRQAIVHPGNSGNQIWASVLRFDNSDLKSHIAAAPDGGFLALSYFNTNKFLLNKFNNQNRIVWSKMIEYSSIQVGTDPRFVVDGLGNILISGRLANVLGGGDAKQFYLFLDARGEIISSVRFSERHTKPTICGRREGGFAVFAMMEEADYTNRTREQRFMLFNANGELQTSEYFSYKTTDIYRVDFPFDGLVQTSDGEYSITNLRNNYFFDKVGKYKNSVVLTPSISGFTYHPELKTAGSDGSVIKMGAVLGISGNRVLPPFGVAYFIIEKTGKQRGYYINSPNLIARGLSLSRNGGFFLSASNSKQANQETEVLDVKQFQINAEHTQTDCGLPVVPIPMLYEADRNVLTPIEAPPLTAISVGVIVSPVNVNDVGLIGFGIRQTPACSTVDIKEPLLENTISVSPNPSNDVFYLKSDDATILQELLVVNSLGQIVQKQTNFDLKTPLSMPTSGTYFLRLKTDKGWIQKKVVKITN